MTSELIRRGIEDSTAAHSGDSAFHATRWWAPCLVCGIPTRRKCKSCWRFFRDEETPEARVVVPYCSRRCQRIDWPLHKVCCPFHVATLPWAPEPEDHIPPVPEPPREAPPPTPTNIEPVIIIIGGGQGNE